MATHVGEAGIDDRSLRVALFGIPRVFVGGRPIAPFTPSKTFPLFAYLLLFGVKPLPRKIVAERLWPDLSRDEARAELRRHLYYLDNQLAAAGVARSPLARTAATIGLDPAQPIDSDVAAFEAGTQAATFGRLEECTGLYAGDLLEPYDDDWILGERERLRTLHRRNLARLIERARATHDLDAGLRWATELQRIDPFAEDAIRLIMQIRRDADDRTGALGAYEGFVELVHRELGVDPSAETIALAREISMQKRNRRSERTIPLELTSFHGRSEELSQLLRLVLTQRLVTLSGPPGVGKTRLAVRACRELAVDFTDGVWFIDLVTAAPDADVVHVVANALARGRLAVGAAAAIEDTLRDKDALIVLDNCEHVASGCAKAALSMLGSSPRIRILATSRMPLGVPGEVVCNVSPLPADAARDLFFERARAARANFAAEDALAAERVTELCATLDGLPLSIEMAAARLRTMSFHELVARLESRFSILLDRAGGNPRHRTLLATFRWSFALLSPEARSLLARLAVFRGGWTYEAARAIAKTRGSDKRTLETLSDLVDHSLVAAPPPSALDARYDMLQSTREFALSELTRSGDALFARAAHARYFQEYVGATRELLDERVENFEPIEREADNIEAALEFALAERKDVALGCDIVETLEGYWVVRGQSASGFRWLRAALAESKPERASSLRVALARLLVRCGDPKAGYMEADAAVTHLRTVSDARLLAKALLARGRASWMMLENEACAADALEAIDLYERVDYAFGRARALSTLYLARMSIGDGEDALRCATEATRIYRMLGARVELAESLAAEGTCAYYGGNPEAEERAYREAAELVRLARAGVTKAFVLHNYAAALLLRLGHLSDGWATMLEAIDVAVRVGSVPIVVRSFEIAAQAALGSGEAFEAAVLSAFAIAGSERFQVPYQPVERARHDELIGRIEAALDPAEREAAGREGTSLTLERAVDRLKTLARRLMSIHRLGESVMWDIAE